MGESTPNSWTKISPIKRLGLSLMFVVWIGIVLVSGFAWPIGMQHLSQWPWNQSWFMFYRSSGYHYYLQMRGTLANGQPSNVSLEDYFRYPAAFHSPRFNELTRDVPTTRRLGAYVCRKYNQQAPPDAQLDRITIWDSWWPDQRGNRRRVNQVAPADLKTWTYLENEACSKLQVEWQS